MNIPFMCLVDTCCEDDTEFYFITNSIKKYTLKKDSCYSSLSPETVGFITKGSLKVYMSDEYGNEKLMWILNEKCILFTTTLDYFTKKIVAETDCEILFITIDQYYNYIMQNKNHLISHMEISAYRYGLCLQQCISSNNQSSRFKVYNFIYKLALKYGERQNDDDIVIKRMPKRCDIASITGVHRSNVTLYISDLERSGIIGQGKSKSEIIIHNIKAFKHILDCSHNDNILNLKTPG